MLYNSVEEYYEAKRKRNEIKKQNIQSVLLNYISGQVGRLSAFDDDVIKYATTGISGDATKYDEEKKSGAFVWDSNKRADYLKQANNYINTINEIESIYNANPNLIKSAYGQDGVELIENLLNNKQTYIDLADTIKKKNNYLSAFPDEFTYSKSLRYKDMLGDEKSLRLAKDHYKNDPYNKKNDADYEKTIKFFDDAIEMAKINNAISHDPAYWRKEISKTRPKLGDVVEFENHNAPKLIGNKNKTGIYMNVGQTYQEQIEHINAKENLILSEIYNANYKGVPIKSILGGSESKPEGFDAKWAEAENALNLRTREFGNLKYNIYEHMTDSEIANYKAIYLSYGKAAANEYFDTISGYLTAKGEKEFQKKYDEFAKEYPFLAGTSDVLLNLTSSVTGAFTLLDIASDAFNGKEYNSNQSLLGYGTTLKNASNTAISNSIDSDFGKAVYQLSVAAEEMIGSYAIGYGVGKLGSLASKATNLAQDIYSTLGTKMAKTAISASNFSSAASQSAIDAISRGVSTRQALSYGFAIGAIEMITENMGYDRLMDLMGGKFNASLAGKLIYSTIPEGLEEGTSGAFGFVADRIINGDKSRFNLNIVERMQNGESRESAERNAWNDFAMDMVSDTVGGAVLGGVFGLGASAVNTQATRSYYGGNVVSNGGVDLLVEKAKNLGVSDGLVQKVSGVDSSKLEGNKLEKYQSQVGKLYEKTVNAAIKDAAKNPEGAKVIGESVLERVNQLGIDNAEAVAEAITNKITDKKLTAEQKEMLKGKEAQRILSEWENMGETNEEGNAQYDSEWALGGNLASVITNKVQDESLKSLISLGNESADMELANTLLGESKEINEELNTKDITISQENTDSYIEGGNVVASNIKTIKTDKNGNISVVFENGTEADLKNTALSNETAVLVAYAREYGDASSIVFDAFKLGNLSAEKYGIAFKYVYDMAKYGATLEYIANTNIAKQLTKEQIEVAYKLEQENAERNAEESEPKVEYKGAKKVGRVTLEDRVKANLKKGKYTKKQISSIYALNSISVATGINLVVYEDSVTIDGVTYDDANGMFNPKNNTIYLDISSGVTDVNGVKLGEYAILRTLSHELTHFIAQNSKSQFRELQQFVFSHLSEYEGKTLDELIDEEMIANKTFNTDDAAEEIVAKACEMMLENSAAIEMLASTNEKLAKSMSGFIAKFKKNLAKAFEKVGAKSEPAKAMQNYLDELQDIWDNALAKAVMNYQASEGEAQADSSLKLENDEPAIKFERKEGITEEKIKQFKDIIKSAEQKKLKILIDFLKIQGKSIDSKLFYNTAMEKVSEKILKSADSSASSSEISSLLKQLYTKIVSDGKQGKFDMNKIGKEINSIAKLILEKSSNDNNSEAIENIASQIYDEFWNASTLFAKTDSQILKTKQKRSFESKKNRETLKKLKKEKEISITEATQEAKEKFNAGEIDRDTYIKQSQLLYKKANKIYGTIPSGENAVVEANVPQKVSDDKNVRRFVRTIIETGELSQNDLQAINEKILLGDFSYEPISDESAKKYADKMISSGFAKSIWQTAVAKSSISESDGKNAVAVGEKLLQQAMKNGDTTQILEISAQLSEMLTKAGQTVQAARMLKQMTGVGKVLAMRKRVESLNKDLQKRHKDKFEPIVMNEEIAIKLMDAKSEDEIETLYELLLDDIASQVPSTLVDKWNAWRYFAMLANPTTHIRNFVGNALFVPSIEIKNAISSVLESVTVRDKTNRTKSLLVDKKYRDFAKKDVERTIVKRLLKSGGKYNPQSEIEQRKRTFKSDILEKPIKGNQNLLETEDFIFKKYHYIRSLSMELQAKKIDLESADENTLNEIRQRAAKEAKKNTYQDDSNLANAINKFAKTNSVADLMIGSIIPFTKTPINIIKRGIEYSPAGLVKTLTKGVYDLNRGKITIGQFIDGVASGTTGTGVFLIGMFLAAKGLITSGFGDEEEDKFKVLNGEQEYAIKIGNKSYTFDWAVPMALPLFMGAEVMTSAMEDNSFTFADITEAVYSMIEPTTNLSMLNGIERTIKTAGYSEKPLTEIIAETFSSYFLQALPTFFGKVANTVDDTRRTNYIDKNSDLSAEVQTVINNVKSKIPGLSSSRPEYVDAWGRTQTNDSVFGRALQNFVSPGQYSEETYDSTNLKLQELYERTGNDKVLPDPADKYFSVEGKRKDLTADEYVAYAMAKGQYSFAYVNEFLNSEEYENLTDEQRQKVIENLYKFANAKAKTQVSDYDPLDAVSKKAWNIDKYSNDTGASVVDYYVYNALKEK